MFVARSFENFDIHDILNYLKTYPYESILPISDLIYLEGDILEKGECLNILYKLLGDEFNDEFGDEFNDDDEFNANQYF